MIYKVETIKDGTEKYFLQRKSFSAEDKARHYRIRRFCCAASFSLPAIRYNSPILTAVSKERFSTLNISWVGYELSGARPQMAAARF